MFYYNVWVRSNRYHSRDPLTYSSETRLKPGTIVVVELQKLEVLGFVSGLTIKPRFKIKPIIKVLDLPLLPIASIKLLSWLIDYYPAPLGIITQQLLPSNIQESEKDLIDLSKAYAPIIPQTKLNDEQAQAFKIISEKTDTYLLHGRTGSGKTRLYIELALNTLKSNRSVIVLTPEISLTSQLANNFKAVFKDSVITMHSKQAPKQRRLSWLTCLLSRQPKIIIGPRSALFAPINNLGLIILDEFHETSYKQNSAPFYQSVRVASYLAKLNHASLILGSATPPISEYFLAEQKHKHILRLANLAKSTNNNQLKISLVDSKNHSLFGQSAYLSQPLIEAISATLNRQEQILLFLNRRGTARMVMCEACGWQAVCPNCNTPLTYHGDTYEMKCHICNYKDKTPVSCPICHSANLIFKTAGTKAIVNNVAKLFPEAKIARFDTDNKKSESFEQNFELIKDNQFNILIGTQMIAKGLDLPKLSLVGVLNADTSLYIPDYTSDERTFQIINQVLGRVGRGHIKGQAIIQSYNPTNPIFKFAINDDYHGFYKNELQARQQFLFPPFCYIVKLSIKRTSSKKAELASLDLKQAIIQNNKKLLVVGPSPAFYEKQQGKYEWQLIIKSKNRKLLLNTIDNLPPNWSYDIDPISLL